MASSSAPAAADSALARTFQAALQHHQAGNLAAAEALYEQVLAQQRGHVETLHLLGVCRHARGDFLGAQRHLKAALKLRPAAATLHVSYGNVLRELQQLEPATQSYDRAARIDPGLEIAQYNLGTALEEAGRAAEAIAAYERALALRASAPAHSGRGNCLVALGHPQEAELAYREALALDPRHADALANLGAILQSRGRLEEAQPLLERALALQPAHAGARRNLALLHSALERSPEALALIDQIRALDANAAPDAQLLHHRAKALWRLERTEESIADLEAALARAPEDWSIRFDLAAALVWRTDRMAEAMVHLDRLERDRPDDLGVPFNRAKGLSMMGDLAASRRLYEQVIAGQRALGQSPGMAEFSLGLIDLLEGRCADGWRRYEARWEDPVNRVRQRAFDQPIWLGDEDIAGARLLVHAEQGLGDTLQFVRYVPWLQRCGASVILEVPWPLRALLHRALPASARVLARGESLPPFDRHVPMMSLPLAARTDLDSVPPPLATLAADAGRVAAWRNRLRADGRRRVGLAWSGNPGHKRDHERSLPLAALQPLLAAMSARHGPGLEFVALQNHLRPADLEAWAGIPNLHCFGEALADFDDAAALVELCDLVLCVDTAAAHLAGSLAKPTWLMLQRVPDWRWMLEREDSPWYPGMRLFRQRALGDWAGLLQRVEAAALSWCDAQGRRA